MNCCDCDCNQGRDCPARSSRRVRAGQVPPDDLPIQYAEDDADPMKLDTLEKIVLVLVALTVFYLGFMAGRVFA